MKSYSIHSGIGSMGRIGFIALIGIFLLTSCNKNLDKSLVPDYGDSDTSFHQGKVLLIMIEGMGGKALQQAVNAGKAPQLKSYTNTAMYTYEGLADSKSSVSTFSNDRGWANLLSGTTGHGIGIEKENLSEMTAPTFLSLIKQSKKTVTTSLFSSNQEVANILSKDLDEKVSAQDDNAVTQAVISRITDSKSEPSDILIAHFSGVEKSGEQEGFYDESGAVKGNIISSIQSLDAQIGKVVTSLKSRPNFVREDWLVIITSNYGGEFSGEYEGTYYDDLQRNTFTMIYNPKLTSTLLQPKGSEIRYNFYSPWFSGSGGTDRAKVRDASLFNMGSRSTDTNSYTIQFMLYDTWQWAGNGHTIISKRDRVNNGPGWNVKFISGGGNVGVSFLGNSQWGGDDWYYVRKNNPWRVYTYVYKECGAVDSLISYRDGVEFRRDRLWDNEMKSDAPLTLGKVEGSEIGTEGHFFINNIQFYNVALPAKYLAANYCKTGLDKIDGFEYWDNLIGYWPNDREVDYGEKVLRDYSKYGSVYNGENAGRSDMVMENPKWESKSMLDPNVCPNPEASFYKEVFNTVDIPYLIMSWFGIAANREWKLEGIGWPLKYKVLSN